MKASFCFPAGSPRLRVAGRGLPGGNSLFFCFAKRKVSKRKGDPGCCVPCASLRGNLRCSVQTGSKTTRFAQTSFCPYPSGPPLLGASTRGGSRNTEQPNTQQPNTSTEYLKKQGHALACPCLSWYFSSVPAPDPDCPLWMRRGAQVQADQGSRCLSEASLARPRLNRAPQVARSEAEGRSNQGRLFFGDFLLAKQKKVTGRRATPGQQAYAEEASAGARTGKSKLSKGGGGTTP